MEHAFQAISQKGMVEAGEGEEEEEEELIRDWKKEFGEEEEYELESVLASIWTILSVPYSSCIVVFLSLVVEAGLSRLLNT